MRLLLAIASFVPVAACGKDYTDEPLPDAPPVQTGDTFYEDIAPLLHDHCVSCHRPGGVGPFSLISYQDVIDAAPSIPKQITTRAMPPWGADNSGDCNTFQNARWMTDAEIKTIADWLAGPRLEGDPAHAPALPPLPPGLARVDATAGMTETYTASATMKDDYRCFIVDAGIATDSYLTGFEVRPGEPEVVHHILMFQLDSAQAETNAAALDAQDPGPGYTCFGGVGANGSLVGVWAPGMRVASYPAGTGLALKGGRKFVLQIHYHTHTVPKPDRTAVDLMVESTVANKSFLFLLAATNLYLPPQMPSVATTNQITLPGFLGNYNVWGVFPHMHTLGRTLRVEADHAAQTKCLVDVKRWDFNWQQGYFYKGPPLIAGGGDTLRITCTHDTTSRGTPTQWGEGTDDEMCLAFLYVSQY